MALVWICNRCLFSNFSTTFLLQNSLIVTDENSFSILTCPSDNDPSSPLQTSSPVTKLVPRKPKRRRLKFLALNCNWSKSQSKKAQLHGIIDLHYPDVVIGCESKLLTQYFQSLTQSTNLIDCNMEEEFSVQQSMFWLQLRKPNFKIQILNLSGHLISFQEPRNSVLAVIIVHLIQELIQLKDSMIRWVLFIAEKKLIFFKLFSICVVT